VNIKDFLLSWEEYNQKEFDVPYVFKKEKDNKLVTYIGVRHSFNPDDKQFKTIEDEFNNFKDLKGNKVVMIEGGDKWQTLETNSETIRRYGEPAFIKKLAIENGFEFVSPEPTKEEMNDFIKDKFSEEEIVYYKVAQQSLHYKNMQNKPNEEEFLQRRIDNDIKQFIDKYKTPDDIRALHKKLFGTDFDLNDRNFFYEIANPAMFRSRFNELAREKDILRDSKIVESIINYWNKGYSIFVVYGSGHIIIQEPALDRFLN